MRILTFIIVVVALATSVMITASARALIANFEGSWSGNREGYFAFSENKVGYPVTYIFIAFEGEFDDADLLLSPGYTMVSVMRTKNTAALLSTGLFPISAKGSIYVS
ncbi:MAG: hypothetical protein FWG88_01795 [Oscillospiraceae bacterium]|nr:hypothetical protein [Oscillospiraceae bacterium]